MIHIFTRITYRTTRVPLSLFVTLSDSLRLNREKDNNSPFPIKLWRILMRHMQTMTSSQGRIPVYPHFHILDMNDINRTVTGGKGVNNFHLSWKAKLIFSHENLAYKSELTPTSLRTLSTIQKTMFFQSFRSTGPTNTEVTWVFEDCWICNNKFE